MLRLEGLVEIIVVIERHTSDESPQVVEALGDERLRLIRNPGPPGLSASRNAGVADVLRALDPVRRGRLPLPARLRGRPQARGGRPRRPDRGRALDPRRRRRRRARAARRAARRARPPSRGSTPTAVCPATTVETPFIPAPALIRRDVFDNVSFDEGYTGNAYRQETAFFVAGGAQRLPLRPHALHRLATSSSSGTRAGRAPRRSRYELSTLRNNWRFLRLPRRLAHARRATSPASCAFRPPSPPSASPRRCAASSRRGSRGGRHEPHGARRLARGGNTGGVERTSDLLRRALEAKGLAGRDRHSGRAPAALGQPHAASSPLWSSRRLMADLPPADLMISSSAFGLWAPRGAGAHPRLPRHDRSSTRSAATSTCRCASARGARLGRWSGRAGPGAARPVSRSRRAPRVRCGAGFARTSTRSSRTASTPTSSARATAPRRASASGSSRSGATRSSSDAPRCARAPTCSCRAARARATSCSWRAPRRSTAAASSACCRPRRQPGRTLRPTASSSRPATRPAAGSCSRRSPPARRCSPRAWAGWRRSCASNPDYRALCVWPDVGRHRGAAREPGGRGPLGAHGGRARLDGGERQLRRVRRALGRARRARLRRHDLLVERRACGARCRPS